MVLQREIWKLIQKLQTKVNCAAIVGSTSIVLATAGGDHLSKTSFKKVGNTKRHITPASELQGTCFAALPFSPVKVKRKFSTILILEGNHAAALNHSSLIAQESQVGPVFPAKVATSITLNKIVQQLGIVSQLQQLLDMYSHNVLSDDPEREIRLLILKTCAADVAKLILKITLVNFLSSDQK